MGNGVETICGMRKSRGKQQAGNQPENQAFNGIYIHDASRISPTSGAFESPNYRIFGTTTGYPVRLPDFRQRA
jgi:hypothetical protein